MRNIFLLILSLISLSAWAHDFRADGIYYVITSSTDLTVSVSYGGSSYNDYSNEYSGAVVIPESVTYNGKSYSVTSIRYEAFRSCSGLTSVVIPSSVTKIGNYAFNGCTSFKNLTIEDGSETLSLGYNYYDSYGTGKGLFYDCPLESVYLGRNISYNSNYHYGYSPFYNKRGMTELTIGEQVTEIGDCAFEGCSGLTSVVIPSSVTEIGVCAFNGCTSIKNLTIEDGSETLSLGYNYYNSYGTGKGLFYDCPIESVYLGRNISYNSNNNYGYSPFYNKSGITELTIGAQVTRIGDWAFYGCSGLTYNEYDNGLYLGNTENPYLLLFKAKNTNITSCSINSSTKFIYEDALSDCSGLTSVVIPSSVTSIGERAFCNVTKAFFLTNTKPSIGSSAFSNCNVYYTANNDSYRISGTHKVYSLLSSMFEVDGVKYIPTSMSQRTCDMVDVDYSAETVNSAIGPTVKYTNSTGRQYDFKVNNVNMYAGYGCKALSDLALKNEGGIGIYAFKNSSATAIDVDNTVTAIGDYAFSGCTSATSITASNNGNIGSNAFSGCTSATSITVTNNGDIGGSAFSGCSAATTINVSNKGYVGQSAFSGCMQKEDGQIIVSCEGDILSEAFKGCSAATTINVSNKGYVGQSAFSGCMQKEDGQIVVSCEGDVMDGAFGSCTATTNITVSNNGNIGNNAFKGSMTGNEGQISITSKGDVGISAFEGCTAAKKIEVSNTGAVGANAFKGSMTKYEGDINLSNTVMNVGNNAFENCTKATTIDIQNEGSLGTSAFSGCSGANDITLGSKITSIGSSCFSGCSSLPTITIPGLITVVNSSTFSGCSSMTSVQFNDAITNIGADAFKNCGKLASLSIPASTTSIASGAFDGCTSIVDLTFEDSETAISLACRFPSVKNIYMGRDVTYSMSKSSPFSANNNLETVMTSMNVTTIPNYAFYNCKSLKDVYLSDGVKTIGTYVFSGDVALANFEVGMSVESIGAEAFSDCTALWDFKSHSILPAAVGTESLDDIDKLECTLHVPEGTKAEYEAADQWKEFWIEDDLLPRYKVIVTVDPECAGMGTVKGSNGYDKNTMATLEALPDEWHRFVEWSDGNKQNPRTMTVTEALNLTAKFAYRYYIKTQPTANNISVALSEAVTGVEYKWYVSESEGRGDKDITNDLQSTGSYAWSKSGGVWTSGNKGGVHSSSSTLSMDIAAKAGDKLSFDYSVSSESGYDYLKIYLGNNQIGSSYSGSASGKFDYTFSSDMNTTLKFVYSKDSSGDNGSDQATISNVVIGSGAAATILDGETTGAVSVSSLEKDKYYYCEVTMPDGVVLTSDQVQYVGGDVKTYTISVTSANGTVTGAGTYVSGATVVLDATPATGYRFVRWSDGNTTNPRTITVTGNVALSAVYEAIKYAVSVTANNGSVSGAGEYPHGSSVTISATPATGYRFVRWSDGNTSNPRAITVTSEVTLSAVFEQIKYKITLTATNGAVSGAGTYAYGTSATIQATPATGYKFVSWSDGNTTNPRVITVSDNLNLEAVFTKESTPEVVVGGSEHGSAGVTEINGNSQTITVTPDKGYIVGTVTVDGEDVTDKMTGNTYIINNVTVNVNVTVVFISIAETAKVSASAGGNVEAVEYDGDKIVLSVTPDAGYEFDAIYVNGAKIAIYNKAASSIMGEKNLDGTYSISGLEENAEIVVNFKVASIMTPVGSITADKPSREGIYDLMGRKLSAPQRGVNIINGKKVVVR